MASSTSEEVSSNMASSNALNTVSRTRSPICLTKIVSIPFAPNEASQIPLSIITNIHFQSPSSNSQNVDSEQATPKSSETQKRLASLKKCLVITFIVLNGIISMGGVIGIGLGIWLLTTQYGADQMDALTGSDLYEDACAVVILGGSVMFLFGVTGGCAGIFKLKGPKTLKNCFKRLITKYYIPSLSLLIVISVVGMTMAFIVTDTLNDELRDHMETVLQKSFNVSYKGNTVNKLLTDAWNRIQTKLQCCGVLDRGMGKESWRMYEDSEFYQQQVKGGNGTYIYNCSAPLDKEGNQIYLVPESCCDAAKNESSCKQSVAFNYQIRDVQIPNALYTTGCLNALEDMMMEHIAAIVSIAVVLCAFVITDFIIATVVMKVCENTKGESKSENTKGESKPENTKGESKSENTKDESKSENTKDESKSDNTKDESKSENTKDESKSENTKDESKSENTKDESKSENTKDESKSEKTKDESKSENTKDESKSENMKDESKSENTKGESKSENTNDEPKSENTNDESES